MNKRLKQLILALTLVFTLGLNNVINAESADWLGFGGDETNSKVYYDKLPTEVNKMKASVKAAPGGYVMDPVVVNDKIYAVVGGQLTEFTDKGVKTERKTVGVSVGFFSKIAYGDGMIFIAQSSNIKAFKINDETNTFDYVWETKNVEGGQMLSGITYYNGYIYTGTTIRPDTGGSPSEGFFFAVKVNGNVTIDPETKKQYIDYAWTYGKETADGKEVNTVGYYWADPAIANGAVVFGGDDGVLVSHSLTTNDVFDFMQLGDKDKKNKIRSSVNYDFKTNTIIVGTQDSHTIYSIEMSGQKFNRNKIKSNDKVKQISGGISRSTVSGNIYVPSGGVSGNGFTILDKELNIIQEFNDINTQSIPLVQEGQQDAIQNGSSINYKYRTYIYIMDYFNGDLLVFKDDQTKKDGSITLTKFKDTNNGMAAANSGSVLPLEKNKLLVISNGSNKGSLISIEQEGMKSINITEAGRIKGLFLHDFFTPPMNGKEDFDHLKEVYNVLLRNKANLTEDPTTSLNPIKKEYDTILKGYEEQLVSIKKEIADLDYDISNFPDKRPSNVLKNKAKEIYLKLYRIPTQARDLNLLGKQYERLVVIAYGNGKTSVDTFIDIYKELEGVEINYSHKEQLQKLRKAYEKVYSEKLEKQIEEYESGYKAMMEELGKFEDKDNLKKLKSMVLFLPEPNEAFLDDYKDANEAYTIYTKLQNQDDFSETLTIKLINVYKRLSAQHKEVEAINKEIEKVDPANVKPSDVGLVNSIVARYNKLPAQNKKYVKWYANVLDAKEILDSKQKVVSKGNTVKQYRLINGKWLLARTSTTSGKTDYTTYYSFDSKRYSSSSTSELNGMVKTRYVKDTGSKIQDYTYTTKGKETRYSIKELNSKKKYIETYLRTNAYHSNNKKKTYTRVYRNKNTNKVTKKNSYTYAYNGKKTRYVAYTYQSNGRTNTLKDSRYNSKGKRTKYLNYKYYSNGKKQYIKDTRYRSNGKKSKYYYKKYNKKGKYTNVYTYTYNKKGQLKSNKHGKAYKKRKKYNSRGRLQKVYNYKYTSKGKQKEQIKIF